jgi:hypothetical protein
MSANRSKADIAEGRLDVGFYPTQTSGPTSTEADRVSFLTRRPVALLPQAVLCLVQNRRKLMPVIHHANVPVEPFRGGAIYQTVIGDSEGSTPIRLGIQTSPPGYKTPLHSHPYLESVTVLEGIGEAWIDGNEDQIALARE